MVQELLKKMELKYIVISSDFKNKIHDVKKLKKIPTVYWKCVG